jgi:hypothetical protein
MMQASKDGPENTEAQGPRRTGTVKCGSNWDTFTIVAGYVRRFVKYVRSSQLNLNQSAHQSDKLWVAIPG